MVPATRMRAIKKGSLLLLTAGALSWQACDPPGPAALLRGERLIKAGRYAGAIEALREATTLLPDNPQAWNHLGLALHWAREYNPAVQAYRQALKLNYDLAPARFNLGSLLLEINQAELAAVEFAAYTGLEPERPGGWVRRGISEWRSRNWDAAHESFQTALRLDAAQPVVWNSVGVIELYRRNHMAAFNAFREALRYQSDYAPAIYNAALVAQFYLPHEPEDPRPFALARYREYLALEPPPLFTDTVSRLAQDLDRLLHPAPPESTGPPARTPEPTNAAPQIVKSVQPDIPASSKPVVPPVEDRPPLPVPVKTNLAKRPEPPPSKPAVEPVPPPITKTTVEPPTPIKVATRIPLPEAVRVPPAPAPAVTRSDASSSPATELERLLGTPEVPKSPPPDVPETNAERLIPNYAGLNYAYYNPPAPSEGFRHKAKPYFDDGRRLQRLNRLDDAITAYQRAIHWDGAYFEAYHNLGLAAAQAQDFLRAAVAYETALALQPQSTATRYNFALLLSSKGYHRDAAVELEKLLQQDPTDTRAHLLLATLYDKQLKLGRQAREHYEAVLELNPGHPQGTAIRYWLKSH